MMRPDSEDDLAAMLRNTRGPVAIMGGATRLRPGEGQGTRIDMHGLSGITLYEPEALTLVVRAGTLLADIRKTLAAERQMLAFEPDPRTGSTIGGIVAANVSGPRRVSAGACRDAMLGVRLVTGMGEIVRNGGRVMKNVTGYDLVKLLAGSRGRLGAITEIALKTAPIPPVCATLYLDGLDDVAAVRAMTAALTGPYDVTGAGRLPDGRTILRLEGLPGSVELRAKALADVLSGFGAVLVVEGDTGFQSLRDHAAGAREILWRIVLRPSQAVEMLAQIPSGQQVALDWGGSLIWAEAPPDWQPVLPPGGRAERVQGAPFMSLPVPDPVTARLNAGLRDAFDPHGLFRGVA
ncbi:MAG: FAD-binding protein [Paracoccus sp. (in: a-proteobacteria)]